MMILAVLLALAGCSAADELATCKGAAFPLNTGRWDAAPADLQLPQVGRNG